VIWESNPFPPPFLPDLTEVTFGNGVFVASGVFAPSIYSFTSPDGIRWTQGAVGIHAVDFAEGRFLGVQTYISIHGYPPPQNTVMTSPDGMTWTVVSTPAWPYYVSETTFGDDLYAALGGGSTSSQVITSPDGAVWTERTTAITEQLSGLAYGNNTFVAVGSNGTILVSADGFAWASRKQPLPDFLYDVAYGNGTFVVVGANGTILQSDPL